MGELETNEKLDADISSTDDINTSNVSNEDSVSTDITEYKEVDKPCVALTIIGENRLSDTEVFVRRGIRYSIKAFFSAIVLTIMNLFI